MHEIQNIKEFYEQKPKIHFKIEIDNFEIDIKINKRITILQGDSGVGKTHLISLLKDYERYKIATKTGIIEKTGSKNYDSYRFKITSDMNFTVNPIELAPIDRSDVIILDEDHYLVRNQNMLLDILDNKKFIVIITRLPFSRLSHSISEIYYLETKETRIKNIITLKRLYKDYIDRINNKFNSNNLFDLILTEDKNVGNRVFKEFFPNIEVISSKGKDNMLNLFLRHRNKYENILVVVDGANFGENIKDLVDNQGKHSILSVESFEFLVLQTLKIFNKLRCNLNSNFFLHSDELDWNLEKVFTKILSLTTNNKGYFNEPISEYLKKLVYDSVGINKEWNISYSKVNFNPRLFNNNNLKDIQDALFEKETIKVSEWR